MTLFIAETNDRVRHRLASIAASVEGIEVVGEAGEVGNTVEDIKRAKPDSVIVAVPMLGGSEIQISSVTSMNASSAAIIPTRCLCNKRQRKYFTLGAN